jgi:hypothetical protein
MAKDPDHLASSFETENTGGLLSGFLAEEDISDRGTLWRLGSWATVTVGAVVVAVLANQSSIGLRREQVAATDLVRQSQQIQSVAKESQIETRRLASAIDTLNGDRDRLYSRVTVLEQGLDSVTGAIARQNSAAPATPTVAAPAPSPAAPASPQASAVPIGPPAPQNPTPAPTVAAVATTIAATPPVPAPTEKPPAEARLREQAQAAKPPEQAATKAPEQVATKAPEQAATKAPGQAATKTPEQAPAKVASIAPVAANASAAAPPAPSAPLMASKSMMAPPDAAASKLIEAEKPAKTITTAPMPDAVASASAADHAEPDAAETTAPKVAAIQRTEFGVDVGGANSLGGLRALWRGLLKYRANAALAKLRPIIVIREGHGGLGMQLRLVAGPLSDAAAAAKICAGMVENERPCETTVFEGQRLAMNADEPDVAVKPDAAKPDAARPETSKPDVAKSDEAKPATAKSDTPKSPTSRPTSTRRRGSPKRASQEEPPPKPEPTTFSSIFSRR